ncbi:MAG: hypothetical protein Kow00124_27750 [Anaerolineae bacterium]
MNQPLSAREIEKKLREDLGLSKETPLIAHVHLQAIGPVRGGAETVAGALLAAADTVMMPAFTYQTMVVPQVGPPDNALTYGAADSQNARAEIFRPDLSVHPDCGLVAEVLRKDRDTLRSTHPILSFIAQGPKARALLASQTHENPLGPIAALEAFDGAVLLIGVEQRQNYSLHLAEQRAGRKTFIRWALTIDDIEELPNIPGCMEGFNSIWGEILGLAEVTRIGLARAELYPLKPLLAYVEQRLRAEPNLMLCDKPSCLSCRTREV